MSVKSDFFCRGDIMENIETSFIRITHIMANGEVIKRLDDCNIHVDRIPDEAKFILLNIAKKSFENNK